MYENNADKLVIYEGTYRYTFYQVQTFQYNIYNHRPGYMF